MNEIAVDINPKDRPWRKLFRQGEGDQSGVATYVQHAATLKPRTLQQLKSWVTGPLFQANWSPTVLVVGVVVSKEEYLALPLVRVVVDDAAAAFT